MTVDPVVALSRRVAVAALLVSLVMLPLAAQPGYGDDIPADARKSMDRAREYLASGEKKNYRKAWNRIKKLRDACQRSVDYWEFFLQLGKAMKKDDAKLWAEIEKAEKANAGCPTFEILRSRLTTDMYERQQHLEKAVEIAPNNVHPKLVLVDHLLATEEEIEAEEILDAILEEQPEHVGALVRKGRVQLVGEYFNAAVEFADEVLARSQIPEMHDLKAQAYLEIHRSEGKDVLKDAHASATEAVKLRPDAPFVVTLARVLEKQGKLAAARDLVSKHHEATPSPLLAGLLGDYAFRTGDYAKAAGVFKQTAATSSFAAKGYAFSLYRLGKYKDTAKALELMLVGANDDTRVAAASMYAGMGRFDEARKALGEIEGVYADYNRSYLSSQAGTPEAMAAKAKESAESDSIGAEWHLMYYAQALVAKEMGKGARDALRILLRKGKAAAGAAKLARPKPPKEPYVLEAKTAGFMARIPAYYKSICGRMFQSSGVERAGDVEEKDGVQKLTLYIKVTGRDPKCPKDSRREWRFNPVEVKPGATVQLPGGESWGPVKEDYLEGCAKLVAGDYAAARAAFDKCLVGEPGWHRVKLLRCVALAMADKSQLATAASDAMKAVADWPTDFLGRELALSLYHWSGQDAVKAANAMRKDEEAYALRLLGEL